jgi:hypothetical protein
MFSLVVGVPLILAGIGFAVLAVGATAPRPKGAEVAD